MKGRSRLFAHRPFSELVAELDDLEAELVLLLVGVGKARGSLAPYPALVFLPDPTDMETWRLDICGASPDCYLENPNLSRSPSASQRLQFSLDQPASHQPGHLISPAWASHLISLGISSHQPWHLISPALASHLTSLGFSGSRQPQSWFLQVPRRSRCQVLRWSRCQVPRWSRVRVPRWSRLRVLSVGSSSASSKPPWSRWTLPSGWMLLTGRSPSGRGTVHWPAVQADQPDHRQHVIHLHLPEFLVTLICITYRNDKITDNELSST